MINTSYGLKKLLKEDHKQFLGFQQVTFKNIIACKQIANKVKRSFGPNGKNYLSLK